MEEKMENLIKIMKESKMSSSEKTQIKNKLISFMEANPVHMSSPVPSPYSNPSPYFSHFSFAHLGKVAVFAVLVVMLSIGGLSFASASALPGDFLYPVKINLKEKIEEKITLGPEAKLALRQKRIETRFKEVETLVIENRLTPEKSNIAEMNILVETIAIQNNLDEVRKTNPEKAELASKDIEESIKTHREKINFIMAAQKLEAGTGVKTESEIENTEAKEKQTEQIQNNMEENKGIIIGEGTMNYSSSISNSSPALEKALEDLLLINQIAPAETASNTISPEIQR